MKLYGRPNEGGMLYPLEWWQNVAYDDGKPVVVEAQKRDVGGEMYCSHFGEFVECGCSDGCEAYTPCNRKNGRCTSYKNSYIGTGILYRITENGSVRRVKSIRRSYDR